MKTEDMETGKLYKVRPHLGARPVDAWLMETGATFRTQRGRLRFDGVRVRWATTYREDVVLPGLVVGVSPIQPKTGPDWRPGR